MKLKSKIDERDGVRGMLFWREDTKAEVFLAFADYASGAQMQKAAIEALS